MEDKTFTQEEVNNLIQERLKRAEEKYAEKYKGFASAEDVEKMKSEYEKQISELNASITSQNEKYAGIEEQLAERDTKIKAFETSSLKTKIAHEFGLNYEAVGYLQGESEEEIKKSAEGLKTLMGSSFVPPLANPEQDSDSKQEADLRNMLRTMKGA